MEMYSPAAIDKAPASRPAMPLVTMASAPHSRSDAHDQLAFETSPSLTPNTAARSSAAEPL
jgi:hypothetical protein